jgi:hypothetical protein
MSRTTRSQARQMLADGVAPEDILERPLPTARTPVRSTRKALKDKNATPAEESALPIKSSKKKEQCER